MAAAVAFLRNLRIMRRVEIDLQQRKTTNRCNLTRREALPLTTGTGDKPLLAEALRKALDDRKQSCDWAATQLKVPPSTLRTWFARGRLPEDKATELAKL